ncbi:MAG: L,D-transpeptidase [Thermanaerothrix sp.]|nr:L,D-transpeptidase [Thermanaerothrix sp.]
MSKKIAVLLAALFMISATTAWGAPFTIKKDEYWIKIDKSKLRLYLMKGDEPLKSFPVAIGRGKGDTKKDRLDLITPVGVFKVRRILQDATNLVFDPAWFNEPGEPQKGVYGSKLISFYNPWQIAIHGTNSPGSIGKRVTHGCIRMRNRDIEKLVTYIAPGTKIWITPGETKNAAPQKGGKAAAQSQGKAKMPGLPPKGATKEVVKDKQEEASASPSESFTAAPQDEGSAGNAPASQDLPQGAKDPNNATHNEKKEYL